MTKPTDDPDDDVPRDLASFLQTLQRRLKDLDPDSWKRCTSRHCRRERRCADDDMPCCKTTPASPMTDDERAAVTADLARALRQRMRDR